MSPILNRIKYDSYTTGIQHSITNTSITQSDIDTEKQIQVHANTIRYLNHLHTHVNTKVK